MTTLELSVSDTTIWSITLEWSIMILGASFTLIYDVYCTSNTYDNCQLMINMFIVLATRLVRKKGKIYNKHDHIKHYGFLIYKFHNRLVCVQACVFVTNNYKSLLWTLSIVHKLQIHKVLKHKPWISWTEKCES